MKLESYDNSDLSSVTHIHVSFPQERVVSMTCYSNEILLQWIDINKPFDSVGTQLLYLANHMSCFTTSSQCVQIDFLFSFCQNELCLIYGCGMWQVFWITMCPWQMGPTRILVEGTAWRPFVSGSLVRGYACLDDLSFLREQSFWSFLGLDSCVLACCGSAAPLLSLQSFYNYARGHYEAARNFFRVVHSVVLISVEQ